MRERESVCAFVCEVSILLKFSFFLFYSTVQTAINSAVMNAAFPFTSTSAFGLATRDEVCRYAYAPVLNHCRFSCSAACRQCRKQVVCTMQAWRDCRLHAQLVKGGNCVTQRTNYVLCMWGGGGGGGGVNSFGLQV